VIVNQEGPPAGGCDMMCLMGWRGASQKGHTRIQTRTPAHKPDAPSGQVQSHSRLQSLSCARAKIQLLRFDALLLAQSFLTLPGPACLLLAFL
jgi:hypothetical protein